MLDFNNAQKQISLDIIPDGTVVPVVVTIRPGSAGEGGWLKRSKNGESCYLDCEFVVVEGDYARRKFWSNFTVEGTTDGRLKAAEISRSRLRAMLESARGINPSDESEAGLNARRITSWGDLDGLRFWAVVGVEPARDGFKEKNSLKAVVTPDKRNWRKLEQTGRASTPAASQANVVAAAQAAAPRATTSGRPAWAS